MIFKSRINLFFRLITAITIVFLLTLMYVSYDCGDNFSLIFATIIAIMVITLLLSILLNTKYVIQDIFLIYRSGPFFGRIKIEDIKELQLNTTRFIGLKMALASKGINVKYHRWDEIYISPENENLFVETLVRINPNITITSVKPSCA